MFFYNRGFPISSKWVKDFTFSISFTTFSEVTPICVYLLENSSHIQSESHPGGHDWEATVGNTCNRNWNWVSRLEYFPIPECRFSTAHGSGWAKSWGADQEKRGLLMKASSCLPQGAEPRWEGELEKEQGGMSERRWWEEARGASWRNQHDLNI